MLHSRLQNRIKIRDVLVATSMCFFGVFKKKLSMSKVDGNMSHISPQRQTRPQNDVDVDGLDVATKTM